MAKSIIEEALMDFKKIQAALNSNTKEMLLSIAKEEIDGLVKESFNDYEEEEVEPENDENSEEAEVEELVADDETSNGEEEPEMTPPIEVGDDQETSMDADAFGDEDDIDMTGASDDDVLAIYKKLSGDDEIEIVGDEIHLNITEPGQYIVKKGALDSATPVATEEPESEFDGEEELAFGASEEEEEDEVEPEMGGEEEPEEDDEEVQYEIAMEDDEPVTEGEEDEIKETEEEEEGMVKEAIPVGLAQSKRLPGKVDIGQPRGAGAKQSQKESTTSNKSLINETEVKYKKVLAEAAQLKKENGEFRSALKEFRNKLVETVVFNANLAYVVRLFTEHATTKDEKQKIIKRFDNEVSNLIESQKLYKSIDNELAVRKPISESIGNKIIKEVNTSSSKKLTEANAYVDPSAQRIKELIKRVENK